MSETQEHPHTANHRLLLGVHPMFCTRLAPRTRTRIISTAHTYGVSSLQGLPGRVRLSRGCGATAAAVAAGKELHPFSSIQGIS